MPMPSPRSERIKTLLAELVAFDTVSDRSNLPLIAHIEHYLSSLGVSAERVRQSGLLSTMLYF